MIVCKLVTTIEAAQKENRYTFVVAVVVFLFCSEEIAIQRDRKKAKNKRKNERKKLKPYVSYMNWYDGPFDSCNIQKSVDDSIEL